MLTIKAEAQAGTDLRNAMLPDMAALSRVTNCGVEVQANGTTFIAYPNDSIGGLKDAYDRLYPESRLVMAAMVKPWPKDKP